jgi:divalent metal cation (Fe/Co/Zn/Cd) transporter
VWSGDSQHRSGSEIATFVVSLVLLMTASSMIWQSGSAFALKLVESAVALLAIGGAGMVNLRFRS